MSGITLEELQDMGVRSSPIRSYLWFKHFVEVGPLDVAAYFLGRIYRRCGSLPESWTRLTEQLDEARAATLAKTTPTQEPKTDECSSERNNKLRGPHPHSTQDSTLRD